MVDKLTDDKMIVDKLTVDKAPFDQMACCLRSSFESFSSFCLFLHNNSNQLLSTLKVLLQH